MKRELKVGLVRDATTNAVLGESHEERIERASTRRSLSSSESFLMNLMKRELKAAALELEPSREEDYESHEERIERWIVTSLGLPLQSNLMKRELKEAVVAAEDHRDVAESHEERIESRRARDSRRRHPDGESHEERIERKRHFNGHPEAASGIS